MPASPLNPRLKIATELIRRTGMPATRAMLAAGYSLNTARSNLPKRKSTYAALQKAKQDFIDRYLATAEKIGLTPERTAAELHKIVDVSRSDKDRINAIREHHSVVLKSMIIDSHRSRATGGVPFSVENVFIVPQNLEAENWETRAIEAQTVERARERELLNNGTRPRNSGRGTHNLKGKEFSERMPERWHRTRSDAIRKGWLKRKRSTPESRKIAERTRRDRGIPEPLAPSVKPQEVEPENG